MVLSLMDVTATEDDGAVGINTLRGAYPAYLYIPTRPCRRMASEEKEARAEGQSGGEMDWRKRRRLARRAKEARRKDRRALGGSPRRRMNYTYPLAWESERSLNKGKVAGIFYAFRPQRLELLLKQSEATAERIEQEKKRGVTVIAVPDNDPDHTEGTAHTDLAKRKREAAEAVKRANSLARFEGPAGEEVD